MCKTKLSIAIRFYFILFHFISYYFILFHIISYYFRLFQIISDYFRLFRIISYYFVLFRIISYYFILFHFIWWPPGNTQCRRLPFAYCLRGCVTWTDRVHCVCPREKSKCLEREPGGRILRLRLKLSIPSHRGGTYCVWNWALPLGVWKFLRVPPLKLSSAIL